MTNSSLHFLKKVITASPENAQEALEFLSFQDSTLIPLPEEILKAFYKVMGDSHFLNRWVKHHPENAISILKSDLHRTWELQDFLKSLPDTSKASLPELLGQVLELKYRHFFRITLRDIGLQKPFEQTSLEISDLAQAIVELTLKNLQIKLQEEFGTPLLKDSQKAIAYGILGMGKLGGRELNFSSDIDLIYYYETDECQWLPPARKEQLSIHEYFSKLSQRLTRFLLQKSSEGFLYRVDLELRPEGKDGTLANSLNAMENYYENFGATWEKQALIKAREIFAGAELFKKLQKRLQPFVFPKIADFTFLSKLREMKEKIERSIKLSSDQGFHVKLGAGGIREIEFFVQSFQLLFGGKIPELQERNTLKTIQILADKKFIQNRDAHQLSQSYRFLRTLENRLQQVEEQQIHRLPETLIERVKTARRMGYAGSEDQALDNFEEDLNRHTQYVQTNFERLLSEAGQP